MDRIIDRELARLYPHRFRLMGDFAPLEVLVDGRAGWASALWLTWDEYLKGKQAQLPRERDAMGV